MEALKRIVIVAQRTPDGKYNCALRTAAGSFSYFYSRKASSQSGAKREAESVFGPLKWMPVPEALKQSEPTANQIAYLNVDVRQ